QHEPALDGLGRHPVTDEPVVEVGEVGSREAEGNQARPSLGAALRSELDDHATTLELDDGLTRRSRTRDQAEEVLVARGCLVHVLHRDMDDLERYRRDG